MNEHQKLPLNNSEFYHVNSKFNRSKAFSLLPLQKNLTFVLFFQMTTMHIYFHQLAITFSIKANY